MKGTILKSLAKILAILSPFIVGLFVKYPLVESLAKSFNADEQQTKAVVGGFFSLIAGGLIFYAESINVYEPKKRLERFASEYTKSVVVGFVDDELTKDKLVIARDVRVNVMFCERRFVRRRFNWFANDGFEVQGTDNRLVLAKNQGVAGAALASGNSEFRVFDPEDPAVKEDLTFKELQALLPDVEGWGPRLRLWRKRRRFRGPNELTFSQCRMTKHVLAVLSVPMKKNLSTETNPHWVNVGVINIDAVSQGGLKWLRSQANDPEQRLLAGLSDYGMLLAMLA